MKIQKKILISIGSFLLFVLILGLFLPKQWEVKRSIVINANPEMIYPYVANIKDGWILWSAFDDADPKIIYRYSDIAQGVGASRSWISTIVGNGFQRINEANPKSGVEFDIVVSKSYFSIRGNIDLVPVTESNNTQTKVIFSNVGYAGDRFFLRYVVLFINMVMGKTVDQSLANLKSFAEKGPLTVAPMPKDSAIKKSPSKKEPLKKKLEKVTR